MWLYWLVRQFQEPPSTPLQHGLTGMPNWTLHLM